MSAQYQIGYLSLEKWSDTVSVLQPVYGCLMSESEMADHNMRYESAVIQVTQIKGDDVHYCRIQVATIQWLHDQPFNSDWKQRQKRARQAWEIVNNWLHQRGFNVGEHAPRLQVHPELA